MAIKIVGEEQVVCDCQGGTPDKYLAELLVGTTESKDRVTFPVIRSNNDFSVRHAVTRRLASESGPSSYAPTKRGLPAQRECSGLWS